MYSGQNRPGLLCSMLCLSAARGQGASATKMNTTKGTQQRQTQNMITKTNTKQDTILETKIHTTKHERKMNQNVTNRTMMQRTDPKTFAPHRNKLNRKPKKRYCNNNNDEWGRGRNRRYYVRYNVNTTERNFCICSVSSASCSSLYAQLCARKEQSPTPVYRLRHEQNPFTNTLRTRRGTMRN